jgi:hypothetical protein
MNIAEINGALWVCGADELVASSDDGGKTWHVVHSSPVGSVLLTIGFANEKFGYAAGSGGPTNVLQNAWLSQLFAELNREFPLHSTDEEFAASLLRPC